MSSPLLSWTRADTVDIKGDRVYRRSLGQLELAFFWDSTFNGTADIAQHLLVEASDEPAAKHLFSQENVERTWVSLKLRFPLLGAQLQRQDELDQDRIDFVVSEQRLSQANPGEVVFCHVSNIEEGESFALALLHHTPRPLSNDLLAQIHILKRRDTPTQVHVIVHLAHLITDGMANRTISRTFLDILCVPLFKPPLDLEDRLAMVVSSEILQPDRGFSHARTRWRRAIAHVIWSLYLASVKVGLNCVCESDTESLIMIKQKGGHTLPRTLTARTSKTPAQSRTQILSLSPELSSLVIANCRKNGVSFGNAFHVLGQIALTRVLCRRYLQGEISEEEWEQRKIQPMHTGGPLNLRPFLDENWLARGGGGEVLIAIDFFYHILPFMPLGSSNHGKMNKVPPFSSLLSPERFFHRCRLIKRQTARHLAHPLFHEINAARALGRIARIKRAGQCWGPDHDTRDNQNDKRYDILDIPKGPVFMFGGSSLGNVGNI
jgi:hypothetical protein